MMMMMMMRYTYKVFVTWFVEACLLLRFRQPPRQCDSSVIAMIRCHLWFCFGRVFTCTNCVASASVVPEPTVPIRHEATCTLDDVEAAGQLDNITMTGDFLKVLEGDEHHQRLNRKVDAPEGE
eukprot:5500761-Amphidinium_carterae.1